MIYPNKDSHYAHRTIRLIHKASVAAEIGRDAFCLITVIVHTEDAARYRGPVNFYNSQLMETLGFKKWDSFDRARRQAIDSGWLVYEGDGKRSPGRYFVTIPDGYGMIDDGIIEGIIPDSGYDAGYKAGVIEGIKRVQTGVQSGDKQGEPPTLSLNPYPNPIVTASSVPASVKPKATKAQVERPSDVDPQTWSDWQAVRSAKRAGPVTQTVLRSMTSEADKAGITLQRAIEIAAARGWQAFKADWSREPRQEQQTKPQNRYKQL
jgi:hypothetical protein